MKGFVDFNELPATVAKINIICFLD
uniref:Uncharacterized protein n=1 Tax=Anguilla anguilla TaxID=7936 RepID=A0A0E9U7N3_ANGAN